MRSWRMRGLAALLLLSTTACYTYTPVAPPPAPEGGVRVRATLTQMGSAQLGSYLGPGIDWIEGTILETDASGLTLAVAMTSGRNGENVWRGEPARLPSDAIVSMERRELSTARTVLATIGVAAAALLAGRALGAGSGRGTVRIPDGTQK